MMKGNPKLRQIFLLGFLLSLHLAFTSYINSSFLSIFSGEREVGLVYILASISSILVLFVVPRLLNYMGAYKFLLWASGLNAFALFSLSLFKSGFTIIPIFIIYFALNSIIIFALDELIQIFSPEAETGQVRGIYLTIVNLAWVIAQAFAGRTLDEASFSRIYVVGFIIMSAFFLTVFLCLENLKDPKYDKEVGLDSFKDFFANRNLRRSYTINFLLQFFFASMVIYMPIYLSLHLGFDWKDIGFMFAVMLLPFVFLEFPLGRYSDLVGERKLLMWGFFIASLSTFSLFFITIHSVWIWALALFATRVGIATVEVMSDVYFFKHISKVNDEFISIYRNAGPASYILAPLLASFVFLLTPSLGYLFILLGIMLLYGVYLSSTISRKDI